MFKKDLVSIARNLRDAGVPAKVYKSAPKNASVIASGAGYSLALVGQRKSPGTQGDWLNPEISHDMGVPEPVATKPAPKKARKAKKTKGRPAPKADVTLFVTANKDKTGYVRARHLTNGKCEIQSKLSGKKNAWEVVDTLDVVKYADAKAKVLAFVG